MAEKRDSGVDRTSRESRMRDALSNAALALIVTVLTLVVADYFAGFVLPSTSPLEQRHPVGITRKPYPYVMFKGEPGAKYRNVVHNDMGYPGPSVRDARDGEFRIFVFGGSTVYLGEPPLPDLIERMAHEQGFARIRAYNFGVISSMSGMDLARLVYEGIDYKPGVVIFYGGGNDLTNPIDHDPRPDYPLNFLLYERNPLIQDADHYSLLTALALGTHIGRFVLSRHVEWVTDLTEIRKSSGWGTDRWVDDLAAAYAKNLQKAQSISEMSGAQFVGVFQPVRDYTRGGTSFPSDTYRRKVTEKIRAHPVQFLDLSLLLADASSSRRFVDVIHLDSEGNRIVAGKILDAIRPHLPR